MLVPNRATSGTNHYTVWLQERLLPTTPLWPVPGKSWKSTEYMEGERIISHLHEVAWNHISYDDDCHGGSCENHVSSHDDGCHAHEWVMWHLQDIMWWWLSYPCDTHMMSHNDWTALESTQTIDVGRCVGSCQLDDVLEGGSSSSPSDYLGNPEDPAGCEQLWGSI